MKLNIGEKIKALRKQQDVTQEKLAAYLNISYQAVSKWENGTAYPDITLVPSIANFFGISTDELLGMKDKASADELKRYETVYLENNRLGKMMDNIELSRKVLEKYPREYQWMLNLAYPLMQYNDTEEHCRYSKEHGFLEEAVDICERILEDCTDDMIRHSAIQILCYNYPHLGRREEALRLAEKMPGMLLGSEALLFHIYEGEEKIKQGQQNLIYMIDMCAGLLNQMAFDRRMNKDFTRKEKIKYIEAAITLFKTMLPDDEDSLFYNCRMSWNYRRLAELYCGEGESEKAMEYLLLAEKTAVAYDNSIEADEQKYNSIFCNRCSFDPKKVGKNWEGTESKLLYEITFDNIFAQLHSDPRFFKLQERLRKAYEKLESCKE